MTIDFIWTPAVGDFVVVILLGVMIGFVLGVGFTTLTLQREMDEHA